MGNKRNPNDIIEMKRLRYEEHLTTKEIGEKFNITKERVRQLIGNTGWYVLGHKDINEQVKNQLNPLIEILRRNEFIVAKDLSTKDQVLLINNHRVKVSLANRKTSPKKGIISSQYTFTPKRLENIDLVILFISETQDIFVIPANLLLHKGQIRFVWPTTARPTMQVFQKFHNRLDLLI